MRKSLRLLASAALFSALSMGVDAQNLGINRNGAAPNTKAILDLDVSGTSGNPYQGMLIPRMTAAQRLAIAGLGVAETGLWVYQTDNISNADATLNAATAHGYWYWDGAVWQRMSASGNGWKLTGNGNTNVANNYLGTPAGSNDDLYVRTTNSLAVNPAIRINANNGDVLTEAAAQGLGIACQPDFIAGSFIAAGRVVEILVDYPGPELGIYAMLPSNRHIPHRVRVLMDFLAARLAP